MKTKSPHLFITLALWSAISLQPATALAQGTAFTYSGRLNSGAGPATGSFDLKFTLFNLNTGGVASAGPVTNSATVVSNGLFMTTIDFGAGVFNGANCWLEIGARTNGSGSFTTLAPRQAITPTPYAIFAEGASNVVGVVPSGSLSGSYASAVALNNSANVFAGSFSGNGGGLTNLNVTLPGGLTSSNLWQLGGNNVAAGQFLGTTNNQALELHAGGFRAMRFEPVPNDSYHSNMVNVIGGSSINYVAPFVAGATIAGGGAENYNIFADSNSVTADFGTVGGGDFNTSSGFAATVAGGNDGTASGPYASVGGGNGNQSAGYASTVSGGAGNIAGSSPYGFSSATVCGGYYNVASGENSIVGGGSANLAAGLNSFAAGNRAKANHQGSFVWADSQAADFNSTANNQFSIRAAGGVQLASDTSLFWGSAARLWPDQGGVLELGDSLLAAGFPYIDFHYGVSSAQDFNVRLINDHDGQLTLNGNFFTTGTARIQGANNWDVNNGEGDFRVGNDVQRFKIGVATDGGGAGDVWMRAQGGTARVFIKTPGGTIFYSNEGQTAGVSLAAGGTAWAVISDRNVKKDFAAVDSVQILEKLAAMPITQWHYKWETADVTPHIGPMAQDFKAAFYPGTDDKSITTQEADGVALAAIQGLNQKVEAQRAENAELKHELSEIKKLLLQLSNKSHDL